MTVDLRNLKQVQIDPIIESRGTGIPLQLEDATVYDFMPQVLGDTFRTVPTLKKAIHFYGEPAAPYMASEEAYRDVAKTEIIFGNLNAALEAYKRSLHYCVQFIAGISRFNGAAALNSNEMQRFNLEGSFGTMENELISRVVTHEATQGLIYQPSKFDLQTYIDFLSGVRKLEKQALDLNRQFFIFDPARKYDFPKRALKSGRDLMNTYAEMGRFSKAAWVAGEREMPEDEQRFTELAKNEPQENPRLRPIIEDLMRPGGRYYRD